MTTIVRVANFVSPSSGGIRTALDALGRQYQALGYASVTIVPGPAGRDEATAAGRRITLAAPPLPGSGGYRVIVDRRRLANALDRLAPDRLEVSDKLSLAWLGGWARRGGVPSVLFSHERLDALLRQRLPGWFPAEAVADRVNRRLAVRFDQVVCTTEWAAAEFARLGLANLARVPLGVDLDTFHPGAADPRLRARFAGPGTALLVHAGRLAPEKRPGLAIDTLAWLRAAGVRARLVVAGNGPLRAALERRAALLGVSFLGFEADRAALARLLASADLVIAPGPVETFGLAALEALACGTPVVAADTGAVPELLAPGAGLAAAPTAAALGAAAARLLAGPRQAQRLAARRRAERFGWRASAAALLAVHGLGAEVH